MRTDLFKQHRGLFWLGLFGLVVYIVLYRWAYPTGALKYSIDRGEVYRIAADFLKANGYDLKGFKHKVMATGRDDRLMYLQKVVGLEKAKDLVRSNEIPFDSWRVVWSQNIPYYLPQERFYVNLTSDGKVIQFEHRIPEDWAEARLDAEKAKEIAVKFLKENQKENLEQYTLEGHRTEQRIRRTDHSFLWSRKDSRFPEATFKLSVEIKGNKIGRYTNDFEIPSSMRARYQKESSLTGTFQSIAIFVLPISILLLATTIFIKKYHEGEVGVRTARYFFIIVFVLGIVHIINIVKFLNEFSDITVLFQNAAATIMFFYLPVALTAFVGWAVGEAEVRENWPSRTLTSLDSFLNRKFFNLSAAESIFTGYAAGFLMLGAITIANILCTRFLGGWVDVSDFFSPFTCFGSIIIINLIAIPVIFSLYRGITYRLFFITWLKRRLKRLWLAMTISALVSTFVGVIPVHPFYMGLIMLFGIGLFLNYLFLKYDLLASIMANFIYSVFMGSIPLLLTESTHFRLEGLAALCFGFVPAIIGFIGLKRQETFEFKGSELPEHVKRISERARITRELEIARQVQIGLLPQDDPKVPGFDIAGICIPAEEVGGDYYDFIHLGDGKIGIAIGDVSGKGVPAAIYMTLTKGVLQSHAEGSLHPRDVLIKVNSLMYRTIKPGNFVSMIYAVIDSERKTLTYARAGHNPVILLGHDGEYNTFLPRGMALGLDRGHRFAETLESQEIKLRSGDNVIFYTDGFTEAMNEKLEEFGEERLQKLVENVHQHGSSQKIIDAIFRGVRKFTGDHPQNDDMTMVVIRVLQYKPLEL